MIAYVAHHLFTVLAKVTPRCEQEGEAMFKEHGTTVFPKKVVGFGPQQNTSYSTTIGLEVCLPPTTTENPKFYGVPWKCELPLPE